MGWYGTAKARAANAKAKAEKKLATPEVRAERAALLEASNARAAEEQEARDAERRAGPDALRAVLRRATAAELADIRSRIANIGTQALEQVVQDVIDENALAGLGGAQKPAEARQAARTSSGRPRR